MIYRTKPQYVIYLLQVLSKTDTFHVTLDSLHERPQTVQSVTIVEKLSSKMFILQFNYSTV